MGDTIQETLRLISWNIAKRASAWRHLLEGGADVALLQEANAPPADVARQVQTDASPWRTAGVVHRPWRAAVVGLSEGQSVRSHFTPSFRRSLWFTLSIWGLCGRASPSARREGAQRSPLDSLRECKFCEFIATRTLTDGRALAALSPAWKPH